MITKTKELVFPSIPSNITLVERFVEDTFEDLQLKNELYGNILVAVTEAATNAIIHGNQCIESKMVSISIKHPKANTLSFTIGDEGLGFDPDKVPDPTSLENIEKPYGRGIFLMRHLSDKVAFKNNGTSVNVEFII